MDCERALVKVLRDCGILSYDIDWSLLAGGSTGPMKALASAGHLSEREAYQKLSTRLNLPYFDLYDVETYKHCACAEFVTLVTAELCSAHKAIPLGYDREEVIIAFANPLDIDGYRQFQFALQAPIRVVLAEEDKIISLIQRYFPHQDLDMREQSTEESEHALQVVATEVSSDEQDLDQNSSISAPIIKLINRIIIEAVKTRSSDIHFDPTPNGIDIRYRVDGVMQHRHDAPHKFQRAIISRIKLLACMNISERRVPQDGRFRVKVESELVDLRVSSVPTAYGEKIVIRLLRNEFATLSFERLHMPSRIRRAITESLTLPSRMILVTGPTGSGKTTTLYTALRYLCDGTRNIETIEDPIEYKIPGANQIQVNEAAHVTFSSVLRALLRQDPDVIMVGEIRDAETAHLALQAAQTGHLVLSTLHTNDAPSALTRLLHLGCDPFIISSSLVGVLAQRLIRTVCDKCREPLSEDCIQEHAKVLYQYQIDPHQLVSGVGCPECRFTGYRGRMGLYSYLPITPTISTLMHQSASLNEITAAAEKEGFVDLEWAALELLVQGKTTLMELRPFFKIAETRKVISHLTSPSLAATRRTLAPHETTIMLVEDDELQRMTVAAQLRSRHFNVIELIDGSQALESLKYAVPDLILTGLGLPGIDGKQLVSALRKEPQTSHIPIVVLTSADSDENEADLLKIGASDFVSRGRSPDVLMQRIERVLENLAARHL